jgi:hypothetical protein
MSEDTKCLKRENDELKAKIDLIEGWWDNYGLKVLGGINCYNRPDIHEMAELREIIYDVGKKESKEENIE